MKSFFEAKKILITGATGFVGSHLASSFVSQGAVVSALGKIAPDKFNSFQKLKLDNTNYLQGSITDNSFITDLFRENNFDYCFHLAGQALLENATDDPTDTFEVNIRGTWNILNVARYYPLAGLVLASTSHVYGNNKVPFKEEYYPRPTGPYETSKACADMLAQTYSNYYSIPVAIARFVNIYGPGDQNNRIVPNTITKLLNSEPPQIYTDNTTRDYMYIDDAVNAYVVLAEKIKEFETKKTDIIFNFGTGHHYSNVEIINKISNLMGKSDIKPKVLGKRKLEVNQQYVSIEKAIKYLNWKPQYSLDEGLLKTIDWYSKNN